MLLWTNDAFKISICKNKTAAFSECTSCIKVIMPQCSMCNAKKGSFVQAATATNRICAFANIIISEQIQSEAIMIWNKHIQEPVRGGQWHRRCIAKIATAAHTYYSLYIFYIYINQSSSNASTKAAAKIIIILVIHIKRATIKCNIYAGMAWCGTFSAHTHHNYDSIIMIIASEHHEQQ